MRRKLLITLCLLLNCCAACAPAQKGEDALVCAIEAIKKPIELMDRRFLAYESALSSVVNYTETPMPQTLQAAKTACIEAIVTIAELPEVKLELDDETLRRMAEININIADFRIPFEYADYYKTDNIQTITMLLWYLDQVPEQNSALSYVSSYNMRFLKVDRQVEYLCINELFCHLSGAVIEDFEDFLAGLPALGAEGLSWKTDSGTLEAMANELIKDAEVDVSAYASFVGEQYLTQLKEQADYAGMLREAGYNADEAETIAEKIAILSERALLVG